jgi:hypothetical protein
MNDKRRFRRIIRTVFVAIAFGLLVVCPVHASEPAPKDPWKYSLLIYGWLPSIDGTLKYGTSGSSDGQSVDASTLIDDIQTVFMGRFEVGKNKWSIIGDVIYLNLVDEKNDSVHVGLGLGSGADIDVGARSELTGWLVSLSGAYNTIRTDRVTLDVLLGTRHFSLDTEVDLKITGPLPPSLPGKKLSRSTDIIDGIVGIWGNISLIGKLYLPYHLDIGTGDSKFSWQAMTGVGYRFGWGGFC